MRQLGTNGRAFLAGWCVLAAVAFSLGGAQLWSQLADPPSATLTSQGVFFGEVELNQQSGVTLWFFVIGVGLGAVLGALTGAVGRNLGVATVLSTVVVCFVVAAASAWLGIKVLGPDEQAELAATTLGGSVTAKLAVSTVVAYLGWPIGGLLGVLAAVSFWPKADKGIPEYDAASSVIDQPARGEDD